MSDELTDKIIELMQTLLCEHADNTQRLGTNGANEDIAIFAANDIRIRIVGRLVDMLNEYVQQIRKENQ
jgi:hypothetical protein